MNMRDLLAQFSATVDTLPADQKALLGELSGRLQSMSDHDIHSAIASGARRGLTVRTGVRAGLDESEDG